MINVRGESETAWDGNSGVAFREAMSTTGTGIDDFASQLGDAKTVVSVFADDMATVKSRMEQARQVAVAGGLDVTDTEIAEPGEAPPSPQPLPTDGSATAEQRAAHTSAQAAVDAHNAKVKAYNEASQIVSDARGKQNAALHHLTKFSTDQLKKTPFTIADVSSGLAAQAVKRTSKFRTLAASYGRHADRALNLAMNKSVTDPAFAKAARLNAQFASKQSALLDDAVKTAPAAMLDKLPQWARSSLTAEVKDVAFKGGSTAARVGRTVLGRVPIAGGLITAAGVGLDIKNGKDPTKAIVSGASSLAAGAAVGAAIGGPVGVVVGAGAGAVVGYVVDEWGDEIAGFAADSAEVVGGAIANGAEAVADGAQAAGEAVVDGAEAAGDALVDGAKSVGRFAGSLF
ncbi:hypothetical protein [Haloechinothrix halophila]|uniref:hypothetical protein n=1 Tax=Haloechinothrix halophila TaxID=1069073 RepID=UPI0004236C45|nr:hypothetical protein [Haloechinothrix halophila]